MSCYETFKSAEVDYVIVLSRFLAFPQRLIDNVNAMDLELFKKASLSTIED